MARTTTIKVDRPARTPMTSLSRIHAQTTRTTSAARRMAMLGRASWCTPLIVDALEVRVAHFATGARVGVDELEAREAVTAALVLAVRAWRCGLDHARGRRGCPGADK